MPLSLLQQQVLTLADMESEALPIREILYIIAIFFLIKILKLGLCK